MMYSRHTDIYVARPVSTQTLTPLVSSTYLFPFQPPYSLVWSGGPFVLAACPLAWSGCPFTLVNFFHLSNLDFYFGQLLRKKAASSINSPLLFHSTGPRTRSACPPQ